ncbi:hypothetical protein D3C87_1876110 [compost metagenome]
MKAVYQAEVAGERHPIQAAHGQQVGDGDDAHARTAGVAGSQVAHLDDIGPVHGAVGRGTDQRLDRFIQVTLQKQLPAVGQTDAGHRTQCA